MLKFEGKFAVGSYVRAYDFEPCRGRLDSYVEGVIDRTETSEYGVKFFVVKCSRDIFAGEEHPGRVGLDIRVPMEMSRDYDHRIIEV